MRSSSASWRRADLSRDGHHLTAVFLDRDGVINEKAPEGDYVKSWFEFRFRETALEALARLARLDVPVFVVTNQRGLARGVMAQADLDDVHARMCSAVAEAGGRIDAIYTCPHAGGCDCRKPAPGLLVRAAADHPGVDLEHSVLVGDRVHDMQAAEAVGARRVYLTGFDEPQPAADHVAATLLEAVQWIESSRTPAGA